MKFCKPCKEQKRREAMNRHASKPETIKRQAERHAKKMQDPEYREMIRLRSVENRKKTQPTYNCVVCKEDFKNPFGRNAWKTCSKECAKLNEINQYQKRESKITMRLGRGIRRSFKGIFSQWTWDVLDFTKEDFIDRFESLFTDGMSWGNMGEWHIDHIRPKASFRQMDNIDSADFKKCWSLNNLQPLWASDNCSKGAKWDGVVNA